MTTLEMTNDVVCAGDAGGNFWILDSGPVQRPLRLPVRVAALAMKENLELAHEVARQVDYSGPQFVSLNPMEWELLGEGGLERVAEEHPVLLLFACDRMHDTQYVRWLDRLLRKAVYPNRLMVVLEQPELWKGSPLSRYAVHGWPNASTHRAFAEAIRSTVWSMSDERGPMPDESQRSAV